MAKDKRYPEKRDINAIVILLAAQGMIHLGEIADPMHGQKTIRLDGARFYTDLLAELKRKTQGNLQKEETVFLDDTLKNLQGLIAKKTNAANG